MSITIHFMVFDRPAFVTVSVPSVTNRLSEPQGLLYFAKVILICSLLSMKIASVLPPIRSISNLAVAARTIRPRKYDPLPMPRQPRIRKTQAPSGLSGLAWEAFLAGQAIRQGIGKRPRRGGPWRTVLVVISGTSEPGKLHLSGPSVPDREEGPCSGRS